MMPSSLRETKIPGCSPRQLNTINGKPLGEKRGLDHCLTSDIRSGSHSSDRYYPCDACGHGTARTLAGVREIWRGISKRLGEQKTYSKQGIKLDFARTRPEHKIGKTRITRSSIINATPGPKSAAFRSTQVPLVPRGCAQENRIGLHRLKLGANPITPQLMT